MKMKKNTTAFLAGRFTLERLDVEADGVRGETEFKFLIGSVWDGAHWTVPQPLVLKREELSELRDALVQLLGEPDPDPDTDDRLVDLYRDIMMRVSKVELRSALRRVASEESRSERERELVLDLVEALGGEAAG